MLIVCTSISIIIEPKFW